jgi:hypothetical protein
MTEVELYNLEPILELMAVGLAVAALPLAWWLWKRLTQYLFVHPSFLQPPAFRLPFHRMSYLPSNTI